MKAVVLGSGGWGTALALVLCDNGHDVTLWSHNPAKAEAMARTRENPLLKGVPLPEALPMLDKLKIVEARYQEVEARLSDPATYNDPTLAAKLNQEQKDWLWKYEVLNYCGMVDLFDEARPMFCTD